MDKIKEFFSSIKKNLNKKSVEKLLLYVGALTLSAFGLIWNLYADISLKTTSSILFLGLLTAIAGGVFIFAGAIVNQFDVKTSGIVFNSVGIALGLGNVIFLLVGVSPIPVFSIITMVFTLIGVLCSIGGLVLQILRKIYKYDEE